jgi:hypothetical protein
MVKEFFYFSFTLANNRTTFNATKMTSKIR